MKYLYICIIFLVSFFIIFKWKDLKKWYEYKTYEENCVIQLEKFGEQTLLAKESPEILKNDDRNIFIATALGYDEVFQNILSIKGSSRNIISGLIL